MSLPKLKFIIVSGDIGEKSTLQGDGMNIGGYVVLHELARILESLGMDVKMIITSKENRDITEIKNNIFNNFLINPYYAINNNNNPDYDENIYNGNYFESGTWANINLELAKCVNKYKYNKKNTNLFDIDDNTIVI